MQTIKNWYKKKRVANVSSQETNFPLITGSLRRLTICAASTLMERFNQTMHTLGRSALVEDMSNLRSRGFNANQTIDMVHQRGDVYPSNGFEKLRFLAKGSPALRFILYQVDTYMLPANIDGKPQKLLLTEDVPLCAQFWEMVLNMIYVETAVLHAGLSDPERVELVRRFNDPENGLLILIIMHSVSSQGVNLDRCCSRVLVVTNAVNAPLEYQSWGRLIRVFTLRVWFVFLSRLTIIIRSRRPSKL